MVVKIMIIDTSKIEKKHPAFLHAQDIEDICSPLRSLNITTFANVKMNSDNSFSVLSNNPTCLKMWMQKQYYRADISTDFSRCHLLNCIVWDSIDAKGKTALFLKDAADNRHNHPFTIIRKRDDHINAYSFGTDLKNDFINQLYINNFDLLENFIEHFHAAIDESKTLKAAYDFEFKNPVGEINHESALLFEQRQRNEFYNALSKKQSSYGLTTRELDCIPMILSGKTMREMAKTLNISPRTIENHLSSLKIKMNAKNKEVLIIKLMKLNLSRFISLPGN